MCVCAVYNYFVCINTHICIYIFKKMCYSYIDYVFIHSIYVQIILKYIHARVQHNYTQQTHIYYVNTNFYFIFIPALIIVFIVLPLIFDDFKMKVIVL